MVCLQLPYVTMHLTDIPLMINDTITVTVHFRSLCVIITNIACLLLSFKVLIFRHVIFWRKIS